MALTRDAKHKFFGGRRIVYSLLQGLMLLMAVLLVYFYTIRMGYSAGETRAVTFAALIGGNMSLILTNLSRTRNIFSILAEKNLSLVLILNTAVLLLVFIFVIPQLRNLFAFEYPGFTRLWPAFASAGTLLFLLELIKAVKLWHRHK